MGRIVLVDIETKVSQTGLEHIGGKEYEPDKRLKDPEKIKASVEAQRQKDIDQAALHWWLSQIICLCSIDHETGTATTFSGDDENLLLRKFFSHLVEFGPYVTLIGKSSAQFDLPFIIGRALAHNIGLPECLKQNVERMSDIDHIFVRYGRSSQVTSLANYAFGLGIEGKLAKGSDVAQMHSEGRWDEIEEYCRRDTEIVHEMLNTRVSSFSASAVVSR